MLALFFISCYNRYCDVKSLYDKFGPVAHLVERLTCTEEVAGSSPVRSTQKEKLKAKS